MPNPNIIFPDKHQAEISEIATKIFGNKVEVWVYGSRVNGGCHPGSDIDMVLKPVSDNYKISFDDYLKFKRELDDSMVPVLMDTLSWSDIPESFKQNILKRYEVL